MPPATKTINGTGVLHLFVLLLLNQGLPNDPMIRSEISLHLLPDIISFLLDLLVHRQCCFLKLVNCDHVHDVLGNDSYIIDGNVCRT